MRRGVRQEQDHSNKTRLPTTSNPHRRGHDPRFHVEDPERLLEPRDLGLDLDDQKGVAVLAPRQHVDRTSLTKAVERFLTADLPAQSREELDSPVLEQGVPSIKKAVELGTTPPRCQCDVGVENFRYPAVRVDRQRAKSPALDIRHGLLRDPGAGGDVGLPQSHLDADGPERVSDVDTVHRRRMSGGAHRRLSVRPTLSRGRLRLQRRWRSRQGGPESPAAPPGAFARWRGPRPAPQRSRNLPAGARSTAAVAALAGGAAAGRPARSLRVGVRGRGWVRARARANPPRRRRAKAGRGCGTTGCRCRESLAAESVDEPAVADSPTACAPDRPGKLDVVSHDEQARRPAGGLVGNACDDFVGREPARIPNLHPGGDSSRDQAVFGRPVEHHHDGDAGWNDRPQPADQGRRGEWRRRPPERVENVGAVDDQPIDPLEDASVVRHERDPAW